MSLFVVGYHWCSYYRKTCTLLDNIPYTSILCKDRADFKSQVRRLCSDCPVLGVAGTTSPQLFRRDADRLICLGGHDDLLEIGVLNVMSYGGPLQF